MESQLVGRCNAWSRITATLLVVGSAGCCASRNVCNKPLQLEVLRKKVSLIDELSSYCPMMSIVKSFEDWKFSFPSKLEDLPIDPEDGNVVRGSVPVFSRVEPTPFVKPRQLVASSPEALRDILDMDPETVPGEASFVDFVSGNNVLPGSVPLAHRYGGHQFGVWAGQLGDGRALILGEYINRKGERWELQLKGSGKTPYSRFGDGRAVLRSSVREFLCSEAMHHLGVPTSRAAALIVAEDRVARDIFYDGRPKMERCAVVLRLAPTWFRIGSLQILAAKGDVRELERVVDFVIENHFPGVFGPDRVLELYSKVVEDTAEMVARWESVGFVHGVMNTDNLSLASITIDYGPFGFVDGYDAHYTPNHSDHDGRYDLSNQSDVAEWNLMMLARSLAPLLPVGKRDQLGVVLGGFRGHYKKSHLNLFRKKLGLLNRAPELDRDDEKLVAEWMSCLTVSASDFTRSFRDLSEISDEDLFASKIDKDRFWALAKVSADAPKNFAGFLSLYRPRLQLEAAGNGSGRNDLMKASNPRYVLRQWMAQSAIDKAEKDDFSEVRFLLKVLTQPFVTQPEAEAAGYAGPVPGWSKDLVVSCSS